MKLAEFLFNGGDEKLPAVRFVNWIGQGCGFCGFYRVFVALILSLATNVFGLAGFVVALGLIGLGFLTLWAMARRAVSEPEFINPGGTE